MWSDPENEKRAPFPLWVIFRGKREKFFPFLQGLPPAKNPNRWKPLIIESSSLFGMSLAK
jgi:hypothetical protein